jgi:hypothetical protein
VGDSLTRQQRYLALMTQRTLSKGLPLQHLPKLAGTLCGSFSST